VLNLFLLTIGCSMSSNDYVESMEKEHATDAPIETTELVNFFVTSPVC